MSRLTQRNEHDTSYFIPQCFEICDGIGCSEQCNNCHVEESLIEKLGAYEDAEEQGLLFRLPCKVGDTVWFVGNKFVNDYEIRRYIVDETGIDCIQVAKEIDGKDYWNSFSMDTFGKTVFLTKEEAEQKLESMKGESNGKCD